MRASRPSRRDDFEIALICALPLEYNAAFLIFDEFWDEGGDSYGKAAGDPNVYTTGRIGSNNAVLALLPQIGKANAASAAASMRSSYPSLQIAILMGICGATPRGRGGEILLGDVIISKAVIQYDFGRQYPDGFIRKATTMDSLAQPNKLIRNLLTIFETDHMIDRLEQQTSQFLIQLQDEVSQTKRHGKYDYPGTVKDKLFEASYRHKHHDATANCLCRICDKDADPICHEAINSSCADLGCSDSHLVLRERLMVKQDSEKENTSICQQPTIHIGPVASGDMVIKSASFRDKLSEESGAIGFEMEGAGLWGDLPCLIVKGACDYADSHKNKEWQNFAAATAASASKAVLERFTPVEKFSALVVEHRRQSATSIHSAPESISRRNSRFGNQTMALAAQFEKNRQSLEALINHNHAEISGELVQLGTELAQVGLRTLEKPAVLREMCDLAALPPSRDFSVKNHLYCARRSAPCNCPLRPNAMTTSSTRVEMGPLKLFRKEESTTIHLPGCPYHAKASKTSSVGTSFRFRVSRMTNILIEASLSYAAGAGGLSISPRLNIQVMISDSPVYNIFEDLSTNLDEPSLETSSDVCKVLKSAENKILRLYSTGEASPYEVNEMNESHLHIFLQVISAIPHFCLGEYSVLSHISQMMHSLVIAGVPCNVTTTDHLDLHDYVIEHSSVLRAGIEVWTSWGACLQFQAKVLAELIQVDDSNPIKSGDILLLLSHIDWRVGFDELLENDQISPLERAVFTRSEKDLVFILQGDTKALIQSSIERGILNLALRWPRGLSLLIAHGGYELVDAPMGNEKSRMTPIELACSMNCLESVRILLAADCALEGKQTKTDLTLLLRVASIDCAREIARALAERRKRLFYLACETLPTSQIKKFQCADGTLPDAEAWQIMEAIQDAGYEIPKCLAVSSKFKSIYHRPMSKAFYPLFFDAGFRNPSERNFIGLTPVMGYHGQNLYISEYWDPLNSIVSVMPWIREHCFLDDSPTDPMSLGLNASATGWHYLASELGSKHDYANSLTRQVRENAEHQVQGFAVAVFESEIGDGCRCLCSTNGCTPFLMYCRAESKHEWAPYNSPPILRRLFESKADSKLSRETFRSVAEQFIRLLTFEALEMTHTCCRYQSEKVPLANKRTKVKYIKNFSGDTDDIREEESELASRLLALLAEFLPKYFDSNEELMDFMRGHWLERMREECIPSEEEVDRVCSVGLTINREYKTPVAVRTLLQGVNLLPGSDSGNPHLYYSHAHAV